MSTLGKILVVLVLIFSVAFAMMAATGYATRANWQQKYRDEVKARKEAELAKAAAEKKSADDLEAKRDAETKLRQTQDRLENEIRRLQGDVAEARKSEELARGAKEKTDALLQVAQENEKAQRAEAERLRKALMEAEKARDESDRKQIALKDELADLNQKFEAMKKHAQDVSKLLEERTTVLEQHGLPLKLEDVRAETRAVAPEKKVQGLIKRVDQEGRYVLISIGSDDELKKGHRLIVYRREPEPLFVGKIEAIDVKPDEAVCKIIPSLLKHPIRTGDHVETESR